MAINRRQFLIGSGIALMSPYLPAYASKVPAVLRASPAKAQLAPDEYPITKVWAYGDSIPGTTLRIKQGETFSTRFQNDLPEASTVHWHGIRIDNKMDGVPGVTQELVPPKGSFDYKFVVPDAGTYWYHSHNRSWEQMAKGLSGPFIVEELNPPEVDSDEIVVIDDWRINDDGQLDKNFGSMRDHSHGGRLGNWVTINGVGMDQASLDVKQNQRLRLRLINTSNALILNLSLKGFKAWQVALDGMPLDKVQLVTENIVIAPAQRVDLIVDVTEKLNETAQLIAHSRGHDVPFVRFPVKGQQREQALKEPKPLPPNNVPAITNLEKTPITELVMEGGAMGQMKSATFEGKEHTTRELVQKGMVWSFNGVAAKTNTPLLTIKKDDTVRLRLVNNTAWPHGIHLHGHHFRQIQDDGKQGPLRDTILINRGETMDIAFVADNPGKWLLHCHMLEHAASGMVTWIQVA